MSKKEEQFINFLCPCDLLEEFDKAIRRKYASRTEAIREAMRLLLAQLKEAKT